MAGVVEPRSGAPDAADHAAGFIGVYRSLYAALLAYLRAAGRARIVTLGPEGTTSSLAAHYFADGLRAEIDDVAVVLLPDFVLVHDALRNGEAELAIFPGAYPGINRLFMDPTLWTAFMFFQATPRYALATRPGGRAAARPGDARIVAAIHPAAYPLLRHAAPAAEAREVSSNMEAARLAAGGEVDAAVTSARCIEAYGLEVITWLWPMRFVWSVFRRRTPEDAFDGG